jgi:hypothetical protein
MSAPCPHKGPASAKRPTPAAAIERLEWWSWRATRIILAGIFIDAWVVLQFSRPDEHWLEILSKLLANGFIGAGLAIEAICIVRVISETRREKLEADKEVAEARLANGNAATRRIQPGR